MKKRLQNIKTQLKRMNWPSPKETLKLSAIAIAIITIAGVAIWIIDTGLAAGITALSQIV